MNVLIIDTSVWIDFFRGETFPELELALKEARIIVPPLVVAELLSGARSKREERALSGFLSELKIHQTPFEHWIKVGQLRLKLAKKGFEVSIPDAHMAQCTLDWDGYLMSRDKIFKKIGAMISLKVLS